MRISLREKHKQRRTAQVLDAAQTLFAEQGYEATRIEEIAETASVAPGAAAVFETTADFAHSGWLAARRMDWQNGHQTHTGAVFVIVDSKPIRVSSSDAEFFVKWIDSLLEKTSPAGAWSKFLSHDRESAQKRYGEARAIFERIVVEAKAQGN